MIKKRISVCLFVLLMVCCAVSAALDAEAPTLVKAPIVEVALFKNGYALVTHEFETKPGIAEYLIRGLPAGQASSPNAYLMGSRSEYSAYSSSYYREPGYFDPTQQHGGAPPEIPGVVLEDEGYPKPVHGTLWIESDVPVSLAFIEIEEHTEKETTTRTVKPSENIFDQLIDEEVFLMLDDGSEIRAVLKSSPNGSLVALETAEGTEVIRGSRITDLRTDKTFTVSPEEVVEEQTNTIVTKRPAMKVTLDKSEKAMKVRYSYLTRGISWAPSYRIDLSEGSKGFLRMTTVIRNELLSIDNAEVFLVSGFPSVEFINTTSPLDANTNWDAFFRMLSSSSSSSRNALAMTQQMVVSNNAYSYDAYDLPAGVAAPKIATEDFDMQYFPAGRHKIAKGESLMLPLAEGSIKYERFVSWDIPESGKPSGTVVFQDDAWDSIRFDNPLAFSMTTAPIAIYQNDRLQGQSQSYWTAPEHEVSARITKALSIKVKHEEFEKPNSRSAVNRCDGYSETQATYNASISVRNTRKTAQRIEISRVFSGELVKADGNPKEILLASQSNCMNQKNRLEWDVALEPGETMVIEYTYTKVF